MELSNMITQVLSNQLKLILEHSEDEILTPDEIKTLSGLIELYKQLSDPTTSAQSSLNADDLLKAIKEINKKAK